jgi:hypothetical protein
MPKQRITPDDNARLLAEIVRNAKAAAKSLTQTESTGEAGTQGGQAFDNPMTADGDLIVGGESGAADRLGAGTDGQVLTVVSGVPAWADATGGTGTGKYRHLVLATDGAGGWGFVTATIDGQTWPITALADLE